MDMCRVEDNPECLDAMEALQEWTRGTTHFSGIIKNEKFLAFRTAAASGRLDLMRILYSWCGTLPGIQTKREMQLLQLEMIKSETAQAFSAATEQGHFEVVKQLYLWGRTAKNSNLVQPSDFFYKYIEVEAEFLDGIDSDGVFVSIDSEIFANQLGSLLDIDKSTTAAGDKDVEEQEIG